MSNLAQLLTGVADGAVTIVDLTAPLSSDTPTLRLPEPFANLIDFSLEEVSAYDPRGPHWKHHNIHTGEHVGTHLDAPIHWASGRDGEDVSQIPPGRLIGPIAVLDITAAAEANPDTVVEISHVIAWEKEHGPLPHNGWLLIRSGWSRFAGDPDRFRNADESGPHSPGISSACARWLAESRDISGLGVETVGIDAGCALTFQPPFPAHYYLLGNGRYGITSLRNLDVLPPTGAVIVVAPLPIVGGTGSPARVLALVDGA